MEALIEFMAKIRPIGDAIGAILLIPALIVLIILIIRKRK